MASAIRSRFRIILDRIRTRITVKTEIVTERIKIVELGDPPHFQGDHDVLLRPRGFQVDKGLWDGGGRIQTGLHRRLEVICRTRLALDPAGEAGRYLLDADDGHLAFEDRIFDAITGFMPMDSEEDENILCTEPIEPISGSDPVGASRTAKATNWGETTLTFVVHYLADLDQTVLL